MNTESMASKWAMKEKKATFVPEAGVIVEVTKGNTSTVLSFLSVTVSSMARSYHWKHGMT